MHRVFASIALAIVLLGALVGADHHGQHDDHDMDTGKDHEDHLTTHKLRMPNADFAFALYKDLNAKTAAGKNIFYSPLGISTALSMLSTGAHGDTHSQLFSTLGYSALNQTQVNEAYENLFHLLGQNQQLDVGDAVAVRSGFNPLEKFLNDVKHYYAGEIFKVDFSKPDEAAAEINKHIANKTHDMIKDMVKDLDPSMAMVLINYVYFRGQWENPFDGNLTRMEKFHVDNSTQVEVKMMRRTGRYDVFHDNENHTTVIKLPYKGRTSMMIVLPDKGKMKEVEESLCSKHLKHWHNSLSKTNVNVFLPKFHISADASLDDTLKDMGMTDAFGDKADFSGISEEIKLKVSKVSHQAVLSVDEIGTEAAAATTIEIMPMSMPLSVKVDRPFMVFIVEDSTKSVLFMGKINNPTAM